MIFTKKQLTLAVALVASVLHADGVDGTYLASTYYNGPSCEGIPPRIQYTDDQPADPQCRADKDGSSGKEESGVVDLSAHATKIYGAASFMLRSTNDECSKGFYRSFLSVQAAAYAATGECYSYQTVDYSWVSMRTEIRNNTATFHKFSDRSCLISSDTTELKPWSKKTGTGYCDGGWLWQVFESTGKEWDPNAPEPTPKPTTPAPTVAKTTTSPKSSSSNAADLTTSQPFGKSSASETPKPSESSSSMLAMDKALAMTTVLMMVHAVAQALGNQQI